MRTIFNTKQDEVSIKLLEDNLMDVMICMNEETKNQEYTNEYENEIIKEVVYEYDFNQFIVPYDEKLKQDILSNPTKYLAYVRPVEKTDKERIAELEQEKMALETSVTDLQLAIIELYEGLVG